MDDQLDAKAEDLEGMYIGIRTQKYPRGLKKVSN